MAQTWRRSAISSVKPEELLLVTDFDGTLAEVVPDPAVSAALPEARAALGVLARKLREVVVLSSRTGEQLASLMSVPGVRLVGESGMAQPADAVRLNLARFNVEAIRALEAMRGAWLEPKRASTTVHFRATAMRSAQMLEILRPIAEATGLVAEAGRRVVEVHPRDIGKGSAMQLIVAGSNPGGVVCLGDDENDRSMFDYVSGLDMPHLCVGVASDEARPGLFERCDLVVSGPRGAVVVLDEIVHWATAGRAG